MVGKVLRIFTCPKAGAPMKEFHWIRAIAGVGLEGDRYALKAGAFSHSHREAIRHVTLIAIEAINEANCVLEKPFGPEETRRNIVTEGISYDELNDLVGKEFSVGAIKMRGAELADPCTRPSVLSGKPGFDRAFENKGGLRAEILTDGFIFVEDEITAD